MVLMSRFCKFKNTKPWIAICKQRRGKPVSEVFYLVDVQIIAANGPVVGLVAVCVGAGEFFAGPDRRSGVVTSR